MSQNGGWQPRRAEPLTLSTGRIVTVRRPGPELTLRAQRVARTFTKAREAADETKKRLANESDADYYSRLIMEMSDEEIAALMVFARQMVCTILESPKLVLNPHPNSGEIGPDDVPGNDFWEIFSYGMIGLDGIKVPVGEGEVDMSDLESFRAVESVSGVRMDSPHVPSDTEQSAGDRGLVDSART